MLNTINIPSETGAFTDPPPDEYVVITPMNEAFEVFADNIPVAQTEHARLSLFSKGNYLQTKNTIVQHLVKAGFTITDRIYIGREDDTKYHLLAIDVMKEYEFTEE
ncbi:hypothetical protein EG832_17640 [bacterium]|nr:hypothetical protein [bacterium]